MNLNLNTLLSIATSLALMIAIYQSFQAYKSDKKLEETKKSLKELEEGMVLSDFKLKKAIEYYDKGHYKNSLEAFKKYSNESEDYAELKNAIKNIFWKESRKIYANYIGKDSNSAALIVAIMTKQNESDSKYIKNHLEMTTIFTFFQYY